MDRTGVKRVVLPYGVRGRPIALRTSDNRRREAVRNKFRVARHTTAMDTQGLS
jgi:hypothetical protein